jgi:hypothetical protein
MTPNALGQQQNKIEELLNKASQDFCAENDNGLALHYQIDALVRAILLLVRVTNKPGG